MSAFTTITISRPAARSYAMRRILDATDSELERVMDVFLTDRLYNCQVVPDGRPNDDEVIGE